MKINRNKNVCVPRLNAKQLIFRHKKTGHKSGSLKWGQSSGGKFYRIGDRSLSGLQLCQGFANDFLCKARTFAALAGDAGGLADFFIAAATFIDRIADLSVGDASAETNIHK
ncbi:hypothetical protein BK670_23935 [Pseudomonas fluorescens]|uniref:Uncharacterized protein n=1 Tax=Pseudomonas fluorescens TaxID=294 RepID=A0A423M821_PSEFL|nr:hypothetical protein BK670_23935 [Pseudomonas fluorescens]